MRKFSKKLTAVIIAMTAALSLAGCGENKSSSGSTINTNISETEAQTEAAQEIAKADEKGAARVEAENGSVDCVFNSLTDLKKDNQRIAALNVTITNNTTETINIDYISYFSAKVDGNPYIVSTSAAQIASNKDGVADFEEGIAPSQSVTGDFYIEIPEDFSVMELMFYPEGDAGQGGAKAVSWTVTSEDIK